MQSHQIEEPEGWMDGTFGNLAYVKQSWESTCWEQDARDASGHTDDGIG